MCRCATRAPTWVLPLVQSTEGKRRCSLAGRQCCNTSATPGRQPRTVHCPWLGLLHHDSAKVAVPLLITILGDPARRTPDPRDRPPPGYPEPGPAPEPPRPGLAPPVALSGPVRSRKSGVAVPIITCTAVLSSGTVVHTGFTHSDLPSTFRMRVDVLKIDSWPSTCLHSTPARFRLSEGFSWW